MKPNSTNQLLETLKSIDSISELEHFSQKIKENCPPLTFSRYIEERILLSQITPSQLIKDANLQRNYGYQVLNGSKNPGRDKVIAICLALSFTLEETQRALTLAKENILYPKIRRDSALIFCINKGLSVMETNDLLHSIEEEVLK